MAMPFFSVVMPLYNKQAFVSDAVQSILGQSFADFELLIIDDASTDESLNVIRKIRDSRIRIILHESNKGLSATRNRGILEANADFVAFLDADDLWKPTFLEKIYTLTSQFPDADIFATSYDELRGNDASVRLKLNLPESANPHILNDYFEVARYQPPYWFGSVAVKMSAFEIVGNFDEAITFGEDTDWNIRANLVLKTAFVNESHAVYRISSENQITDSNLSGRKITDFDKYENANRNNLSLKKFLDANRYFLAMIYKVQGSTKEFGALKRKIDPRNLSSAQKIMLAAPVWTVVILKRIKNALLRMGFRFTTFSGR